MLLEREGFGQVEPNMLTVTRSGKNYALLPAASTITSLENGQFVKYDQVAGEVNFTGAGQWKMVFNEVKLYDDGAHAQFYKDYVMEPKQFTDGKMYPRCIDLELEIDRYTTNTFDDSVTEVEVGDLFAPTAAKLGKLVKIEESAMGDHTLVLQAIKCYSMPDGQPGVKLIRVK